MAEKKKGLRLRFWKKKKDLPEVELTRKAGELDLHARLLAEERSLGAVKFEDLDVSAEEDDTSEAGTPTRLGIVNTKNPTVREGVTQVYVFLLDDLMELEIIRGSFQSIMDFAGREALLEIQIILTTKMEEIFAEGASSDDGEIFNPNDISAVLEKFNTHLSPVIEETRLAVFGTALSECLRRLNEIIIDVKKKDTGEDGYHAVVQKVTSLAISGSNVGAEGDDCVRIDEESREDQEVDHPNGAAARGGI